MERQFATGESGAPIAGRAPAGNQRENGTTAVISNVQVVEGCGELVFRPQWGRVIQEFIMSTTTQLSTFDDPTFRRELLTVASFLAGYGPTTRASYATDLRIFSDWCRESGLSLFDVKRSHLELFVRSVEARGLIASTITRRLSALASFYRYCEQEDHIDRNPANYMRRPKVDNESRTPGLDRTELSAFMVQAGIGTHREHALASLLALNGPRVSEALNADIDDLRFERDHHFLRIIRKGGIKAPLSRSHPGRPERSRSTSVNERAGRSF
ncbi:MAG: site-specific integrase [Acidimicrobiia bacterium]|nr:site-specific integrase [Acidimicrobiia bacterium]